jgi:hypothetical protein
MVPQILHRVCFSGSKLNDKSKASMAAGLTIKPAILHDYCRHKVRYADYPGIVAEEGHSVRGTYVTGLTRLYIQNLDVFEGDEYRRSKVKVQLLKPDGNKQLVETGEEVETETYVWFDRRSNLETEEWDFEEFRRSKLHRWVDSSEEYQGKSCITRSWARMLIWARGRRTGWRRT